MEALARDRPSPATGPVVALWGGGALLAAAFGLAVATSLTAVAALIGVLAALAVVATTFTATRWALIVLLFLLYSYAGWVIGHAVGAPEVSQPLLLIIILALVWRGPGMAGFSVPGELLAVLILGLTMAVSLAFTLDVDASLQQLWDFIGYALIVVAILALLDRPVWLRRAVWAVVIAGGALAIISVFQAATGAYEDDFAGFAIARPEGAGVFRVGGPLDPNFFGQVLVATAILALYLALSTRELAGRWGGLAILAVCLAATGLTGSRGALVAVAAAFCLVLLLAPIPRDVGAGIAALVVAAGLIFLPGGLQARVGLPTASTDTPEVATVTQGSENALRGRKSENLAALQMFRDNPILGVGPGNYSRHYLSYSQRIGLDPRLEARESHSLYLGTLAETGIVGGCALFAVLWLALRGAWRGRRWLRGRDALLAEGIFVALASYLVAGLFLHAAYPRYMWILVGFGFVAGQLARKAAPSPAPAEAVPAESPVVPAPRQAPALRPRRHRRVLAPLITAAVAIAACVAIISLALGGDEKKASLADPSAPPAVNLSPSQGATAHCDPIMGSGIANAGQRYPVSTFDPDGKPADCAKAQSILLSALNSGGATIGGWSCSANPAGPTIATCTSASGARIWAGN